MAVRATVTSLSRCPGKPLAYRPPSMTSRLFSTVLSIISLSPIAAGGATYYVDSVNGADTANNGQTPSSAWKTLAKVNEATFQPGDSILFKRGGHWSGTLSPSGAGGTSSAPIVFGCYGESTDPAPHIQGSNGAAIKLWNKSYVTIQDFDLTNDPAQTPFARNGIHLLYQKAGSYGGIKILKNEIRNIVGYTTRGGALENYSNAAIYVEFSKESCPLTGMLIEGNYIHDVKCLGILFKSGAFMNGNQDGWIKGLVIRDNLITKTGGDHIVVQGANAPLIEYNAGYDAGILAAPKANLWIAGMWVCYNTKNSLFQYNEVARTTTQFVGGDGDSMAFDVDYGTVDNHVFQYNYTHDNEGGALLMMPPSPIANSNPPKSYPPAAKTVIYRYNISVNDNRNNASGRQVVMHTTPGVNSAHIYNNIFYNNRPLGLKFSDTGAEYYSNNIFYAQVAHYGSTARYSNNCYFGHNPVVNDDYKVVADPKFVGPLPGTEVIPDALVSTSPRAWASVLKANEVFKLQSGSPCIGQGKEITPPTANGARDFWGNPLYSGAPDIGVCELPNGTAPPPPSVKIIDNTDRNAVRYGGNWKHVTDSPAFENSTVSINPEVGGWVQCSFTGTNISLGAMRGPGSGKVSIQIDNNPPVIVDLYWPATLPRQDVFQAAGLSNTSHTLKATIVEKNPSSTWTGVHVDCFKIRSDTPLPAPTVTIIDNPAGTYHGAWTAADKVEKAHSKTQHTSSTIGDTVSFTFTGTGVRLYGPKSKARGNLKVTLNGESKSISCYTPGKWEEVATRLYEVTGLAPGTHTLQAEVAAKTEGSSSNSVAIDFLEVLSQP